MAAIANWFSRNLEMSTTQDYLALGLCFDARTGHGLLAVQWLEGYGEWPRSDDEMLDGPLGKCIESPEEAAR